MRESFMAMHGAAIRLVFLLGLALLAGCGGQLHKQQAYVFGTLVEITVYGRDEARSRQATDAVLKEFDRMHRELHPWEPGPMEDLNAAIARGDRRIPLPAGLGALIEEATHYSEQGEGLFNPAIGNLVRLWGFHTDTFVPKLPDPQAIARLVKAHPRMTDLSVEGDNLISRNPAVRLDFGGYAKGLALDRAAAIFNAQGVHDALINIGGNILALGSKGGSPWKVGIQHPRHAGALAVLELHDGEAIGTSGDYQRFFEVNGKRYCHLIDPRSGLPADRVEAVTVLTRGPHAGTLSDVASKPLFIAGPADWRRMAARMGITEALMIATDGRVEVTRALAGRLEWEKPVPPARVVD